MTYLLDVNVLVALGLLEHNLNGRVADWIKRENYPTVATCSITELGFVRVLSQASSYGLTVAQAQNLLLQLKQDGTLPFIFIPDNHDITRLPKWVTSSRQTSDGHLLELASAHDAILATLDGGIPGAYLIPSS